MSDILADRTPPQNIEAEQAILGAVFLEQEALVTASETITSGDFYRPSHQRIFQVMVRVGGTWRTCRPSYRNSRIRK